MSNKKTTSVVTATVNELIMAATTFDIDALERIYHDSLEVIMIDNNGSVSVSDKAAFKELFQTKRANGSPPLNTWADFHRTSVDGELAHVLVSRKVNLMDADQLLTLSIDLRFEQDRWQVVREVIFARPDDLSNVEVET